MQRYSQEFIRAIPKTDLHVHLDGSLRLPTLIELARERKVPLPSFTEQGLNELVFKDSYADLEEYLKGFTWTLKVLQDPEGLERAAYELGQDNWAEGVRYVEVRFAPQLHMGPDFDFESVMRSVDRGLRRAREEANRSLGTGEPPFDYGIIVCALRFFDDSFSAYYRDICRLLSYSSQQDVIRAASLELARAGVRLRRDTDVQIVGFDLAGSESGYPASAHEESYDFVHKNFMRKTVHAGEAYGPESIFQAVAKLHADRIGHGLHLFDEGMIFSGSVQDKRAYIENLVDYIAENRTTIEVCLTSNLQTSPDPQGHPRPLGEADARAQALPHLLHGQPPDVEDLRREGAHPGAGELRDCPRPAQGHHCLRVQALLLLPSLFHEEEMGAPGHRLLRDAGKTFRNRVRTSHESRLQSPSLDIPRHRTAFPDHRGACPCRLRRR